MLSFLPRIRVADDDPAAVAKMAGALAAGFRRLDPEGSREVIVLGIGTDRSTGDSLGPLVGSKLAERGRGPRVLGTLDNPVHATNLLDHLRTLGNSSSRPLVVAVDASLGQRDSIGLITVAEGPLRPGAGVHKELPSVGDLHGTGVVNVAGYMDYMVLQNTRLSLVMRMAERIAAAVLVAWETYYAARPEVAPALLSPQEASC